LVFFVNSEMLYTFYIICAILCIRL
jgi:hypothetical protein